MTHWRIVLRPRTSCDDCDVATCQVRHLMLDVRNAIAEVLDNTSLTQMKALGGADALVAIQASA